MSTTNLNIRTDKEVKKEAEELFNELGLTMTSAINIFLKACIREQGIPFPLMVHEPNRKTLKAFEEGDKLLHDKNAKSYTDINELKKDLEI